MRCPRVVLIHNTVTPYRHPLFEKLSKKIDLMVYYCSINHELRRWDLWPRDYDYKYKILPRIPIKTPIGEHNFNPSKIKEIIKRLPNTIIISSYTDPITWLVFIIAKLLRIPIIYWTEGIKEPTSILGRITRPLRMLFIRSNAIVVPGKLSKNYVINLGADPKKVFIAPNAIDNELFIEYSDKYKKSKNQTKNQLRFKDKVIILYVGQLIERKGIKYLLYAYANIKKEYDNAALLVVGSGPLKSNLKKLANSLEFRDFKIIESGLALNKLIMLYSVADIFVLPTLEDVWGFVINEAMACGLPVISTHASQAATEMIRPEENGYVVREANSEELYMHLKKLIGNSELRTKMGEKSREIVEHEFDMLCMVKGFMSAIEHVMDPIKGYR